MDVIHGGTSVEPCWSTCANKKTNKCFNQNNKVKYNPHISGVKR